MFLPPLVVEGGWSPSRSKLGRPVATEEAADVPGSGGARDFWVGVADVLSIVEDPTCCPPCGTFAGDCSFDIGLHMDFEDRAESRGPLELS